MKRSGEYRCCVFCKTEVYVPKVRLKSFKFCSKKCYSDFQKTEDNTQRRRKSLVCKWCGKEEKNISQYLNRTFCSLVCYGAYKKENPHNVKKQFLIKNCEHCKKDFDVWNYRADTARFCSNECYDESRRYEKQCLTCKKVFKEPNYNKKIYCSQECFAKSTDKRKSQFSKSVYGFLKKRFLKVSEEECFKGGDYKFFVDFLIDDQVAVECDGTYWHCDPDVYDEAYFNSKVGMYAKEIWERDKKKDKCLYEDYKLLVIRFKEKEWSNDKSVFFKKMERKVNEILKNKVDKRS